MDILLANPRGFCVERVDGVVNGALHHRDPARLPVRRRPERDRLALRDHVPVVPARRPGRPQEIASATATINQAQVERRPRRVMSFPPHRLPLAFRPEPMNRAFLPHVPAGSVSLGLPVHTPGIRFDLLSPHRSPPLPCSG